MLRNLLLTAILILGAWLPDATAEASEGNGAKLRIVVLSSHHREYLWSRDTNACLSEALLDFGYLNNSSLAGILSAVEDSGFNQGYEAKRVADRILRHGDKPGEISVCAPKQGPFIVNTEQACRLGIDERILNHPLVEKTIDFWLALKHQSEDSFSA